MMRSGQKTQVLVVDDSASMRQALPTGRSRRHDRAFIWNSRRNRIGEVCVMLSSPVLPYAEQDLRTTDLATNIRDLPARANTCHDRAARRDVICLKVLGQLGEVAPNLRDLSGRLSGLSDALYDRDILLACLSLKRICGVDTPRDGIDDPELDAALF